MAWVCAPRRATAIAGVGAEDLDRGLDKRGPDAMAAGPRKDADATDLASGAAGQQARSADWLAPKHGQQVPRGGVLAVNLIRRADALFFDEDGPAQRLAQGDVISHRDISGHAK